MKLSVPIKINKIHSNVYHFDFDNIWTMNKYLGRMQEHAENPKFYKQVFSTSRIKNYYKTHRIQYRKFAIGFNIPGWAFQAFFEQKFTLTLAEKEMLEVLKSLSLDKNFDSFYIISSADGNAKTPSDLALDHEIAHSLFYTNKEYKEKALQILEENKEQVIKIRNTIAKWGIYTPEVFDDELHAYLATDSVSKLQGRFKVGNEILVAAQALSNLFKEYNG